MSIRFNHASNKITSTNTATILIEGGVPTSPRSLRLDASSIVFPNKNLPIGEAGAVVFDISSNSLKYHNGFTWVELLSRDDILAPVNVSLTDIYNKLANRVSTVSFSSSAVPSASVSGTNLNIVFPSSTTPGNPDVPGLFTSSPPGSIMHYSLISGQTVASIREQMSGVINGQAGRDGTASAPFVTKTGWCLADDCYWVWNGTTPVTKRVPNLNQDVYLKGITTTGVTKTDTFLAGSGTISTVIINQPPHYHGVGMMAGVSGNNADDGFFISGKTWDDGLTYSGLRVSGKNDARESRSVSGSDSRTAFSTTLAIYPEGNTTSHNHTLSNVDVNHFNVAILYNIAEPSSALNQSAGDARYVLKTGDTMTGSLTIANSAAIKSNDTNLILWFRDNSGGERAAIYHNTTTNSLRFRSAGGSEVVISNTGAINVNALSVSSVNATVGGLNIVRSVNGVNADSNGNVILAIPGVQGLRFGALQSFRKRNGTESIQGGVMTAWADFGDSNYWVYLRPLQYLMNDTWQTVAYT